MRFFRSLPFTYDKGMQIIQRLHFKRKICWEARQNGLCKANESNLFPCQEACRKEHGVACIRFSSSGNSYACMQCPEEHPPCVHHMRFENISLENFMTETPRSGVWEPLCIADCIEINEGVKIHSEKCVGCLLCAAYCPIYSVVLDSKMRAHICSPFNCSKSCTEACPVSAISIVSDFDRTLFESLKKDTTIAHCEASRLVKSILLLDAGSFSNLFSGTFKAFRKRLGDADKFISWTGSAFPKLFGKPESIVVGYEVQVKEGWRPLRLELSVRDRLPSFFFFAKFKNDLEDFQFIDRHLLARRTIKHFLSSFRKRVYHSDFLVANYPERKIFRNGALLSTLLSRLEKYQLPLISLQALYGLLAFDLFSHGKISFDKLYNLLMKENRLYLLTSDKRFAKAMKEALAQD